MDIASFLVAAGSFITPNELLSLTEALRGDRIIDWGSEEIVADHHCLGEIPGNKADLIVTAIVAAYGLPMPKTVSRSLSGCTGAADTMEILAGTDLDVRSLKKQVLEKRGAIVNPEGLDIAAADKIISAVEQQNGLATLERSIASVLASKMAAGITHLLIDIPVGPRARVRSTQEAMRLRKLIEYVGDMMEINVDVVITDDRLRPRRGAGGQRRDEGFEKQGGRARRPEGKIALSGRPHSGVCSQAAGRTGLCGRPRTAQIGQGA